MTTFNVVPWLIILLLILLAAIFILPISTGIWWAILAVSVVFYGGVMDWINRGLFRKEHEAEIAAQTAIIDAHWRRIEAVHGVEGRKRAVALAMKEHYKSLDGLEELELAFLCNDDNPRFSQLAVKRIQGKLTRAEAVEFRAFFRKKAA